MVVARMAAAATVAVATVEAVAATEVDTVAALAAAPPPPPMVVGMGRPMAREVERISAAMEKATPHTDRGCEGHYNASESHPRAKKALQRIRGP
mmetsp:Transcript_64713/g.151689  ORF Transcript_64713/g.151689 Transcript_64713/m.151689 type:complete len:94 (+) Transcript_64713:490-771(+)